MLIIETFSKNRCPSFPRLPLAQHKHRQEKENTNHRHDQSTDSACRQREPEGFFVRANHKGNKAKYGRNDRQKDRYNLRIPGLGISTKGRKTGESAANTVVLVQNIDTGIHRDAAQQDKRSKSSLVEVQTEPIEREEYSYIGNRDHEDNSKRLFQ